MSRFCFILLFLCSVILSQAEIIPPFGQVRMVDRVDCTKKDHRFVEFPEGGSYMARILGKECRVMDVQAKDASFMAWRLGEGKGLKANGSYVLVIDYPEDAPRSWIVHNKGVGMKRGFYTGRALGDALYPKYVDNHCESLNLPLSGKWEQWTALTTLQDRYPGYAESVENHGTQEKPDIHTRWMTPEEGFDVVLTQYDRRHAPISKGLAVRAISLYEIPDEAALAAPVVLPEKLPQRHLFWREEMSDNSTINGKKGDRGMDDQLMWFDQKARQMRFLGMNTFSKDLLEFGAVQHWDPNYIRRGWMWDDASSDLWGNIVELMGKKYNFWVFPYYEYCGALGPNRSDGSKSLGYQKRARPLGVDPKTGKDMENYTHIFWVEKGNVDVSDPDARAEVDSLLKASVLRFKDKARFLGAWLRPRAQMPVGFASETVARFNRDMGMTATRESLRESFKGKNKLLYEQYLDWWHNQRKEFLEEMRRFLKNGGLESPVVLFTGCSDEPGQSFAQGSPLVTSDETTTSQLREAMEAVGYKTDDKTCMTTEEVTRQHLYQQGCLAADGRSWAQWEWMHARPADDPQRYQETEGVYLSMPYNRLYTVDDSLCLKMYQNGDGGMAMIRHYSLNENMIYRTVKDEQGKEKEESLVGYAMADMERAGWASMQSEVEAMAKGNPYLIGYLTGSTFARGFPQAVRDFNQNFLALPALPSQLLFGASTLPDVTVRQIQAGKAGCYYAIVYTGSQPLEKLTVKLPADVSFAWMPGQENRKVKTRKGRLTLKKIHPFSLITLHVP